MVCDNDPQVRARVADQHSNLTVVSDYESVLQDADIEAVVIALPAVQHYETAKLALESGKHVFVEKPMTTRVDEAEELVEIAERNHRTLMVGHLLVHHPAVDTLKRLINDGELGETYYLYSQRVNLGIVRKDENALWSLAPHDIAVMLHLLDQEPDAVSARGECYLQKDIQDVVFLNLHFKDGKMGQLQVSWLDPHKIRRLTIVGSEKMAVFDDMESAEKIRIYDKSAERDSYESYGEAITLRFGDVVIPHIHMDEPLKLECQHFVDCVRDGAKPRSDGQEGLRVVRVLAAAQRSLEQDGVPVMLESDRG
jgi:predicted dehydrogenase